MSADSEATERGGGILSKDVIVAIPLFATALATAYEMGSFIPIGFSAFRFFTLSEHALFALEGLPFALCVSAATAWLANQDLEAFFDDATSSKRRQFWIHFPFLLGGAAFVALGVADWYLTFFIIGFLFCVMIPLLQFFPAKRAIFRSPAFPPLAACLLLFGAMAVGIDGTRAILNFEGNQFEVDAVINGNPSKTTLLRSGERGLLLYDRETQSFSLETWDAVKHISWKRQSLKYRANWLQ